MTIYFPAPSLPGQHSFATIDQTNGWQFESVGARKACQQLNAVMEVVHRAEYDRYAAIEAQRAREIEILDAAGIVDTDLASPKPPIPFEQWDRSYEPWRPVKLRSEHGMLAPAFQLDHVWVTATVPDNHTGLLRLNTAVGWTTNEDEARQVMLQRLFLTPDNHRWELEKAGKQYIAEMERYETRKAATAAVKAAGLQPTFGYYVKPDRSTMPRKYEAWLELQIRILRHPRPVRIERREPA